MIAQRLRPIGWVASVAVAAVGFYLVSLQVAAERTALETVDAKIATAKRDIRRLQTEFGARASLAQLERYNGEVLALSAPVASQYLEGEFALASYNPDGHAGSTASPPGSTVLASAQATPTAAKRPVLVPAIVTDATRRNAPVTPAVSHPSMIQAVAMVEDRVPRASTPAPKPMMQRVAMLDPGTLGEIDRRAAREAGHNDR